MYGWFSSDESLSSVATKFLLKRKKSVDQKKIKKEKFTQS